MDFYELSMQRRSVRSYTQDPVESWKLKKILEAGVSAPNAAEVWDYRIMVLHTEWKKEELLRIYSQEWFVCAPVIIGVVALPGKAWRRRDGKNYADINSAIVMDHIVLQASDLGLGTCWVSDINVEAAHTVLDMPSQADPIAFTPLGYPKREEVGRTRIIPAVDTLVMYDGWKEAEK